MRPATHGEPCALVVQIFALGLFTVEKFVACYNFSYNLFVNFMLDLVLFRLNNLLHITIFHMKCVVAGNFDGVIQTEYFHFHRTNHSGISSLVTQVFILLGTG